MTDINIQWGEPVQIFRTKPTEYPDGSFYPHSHFEPDCFPVSATYDDYGYFKDVEVKPVNSIFDPIDTEDDNQRESYLAVHKVVYDHLSERIQTDSESEQEIWLLGKRTKNSAESWQKVIDQHIERREQLEQMYELMKTEDYKTAREKFPSYIYMATEEFRNLPFSFKRESAPIDYFREPTLAEEIFRYKNFHINMMILNKNFRPSIYAAQTDNYEIYRDHLIPLMQKVCTEKDRRWEEDN